MNQLDFRRMELADIGAFAHTTFNAVTSVPDYLMPDSNDDRRYQLLPFEKFPHLNYVCYGAFSEVQLIAISFVVFNREGSARHRCELICLSEIARAKLLEVCRPLTRLLIGKAFELEQVTQVLVGVKAGDDEVTCMYKQIGFVQYGSLDNYYNNNKAEEGNIFMSLAREKYLTATSPKIIIPKPFDRFI